MKPWELFGLADAKSGIVATKRKEQAQIP